jgi:hypothetical protein
MIFDEIDLHILGFVLFIFVKRRQKSFTRQQQEPLDRFAGGDSFKRSRIGILFNDAAEFAKRLE